MRKTHWLRTLVALILSAVLTVQGTFEVSAGQSKVLADGRIEMVLCGGNGMRTVIYDPQTGDVEPSGQGENTRQYCACCLIGPAIEAASRPISLACLADLIAADFPLPAQPPATGLAVLRLQPIRGPPVSLI